MTKSKQDKLLEVALWLEAVILLALFTYLYLSRQPPEVGSVGWADKAFHFIASAGIAIGSLAALSWHYRLDHPPPKNITRFVLGGLALFTIGLELTQRAVGRDVEVLDGVANVAGIVGAAILWSIARATFAEARLAGNDAEGGGDAPGQATETRSQ